MKRILYATKDTYITNRIIRDRFRATDANVGLAGTLDLFKLADESSYTTSGPFMSSGGPIELSRILIKFDITPLQSLTSSILNLNDPSFKCTLTLNDVMGGQTLPSNFSITLYPLSQSFDEGIGRDVNTFEDVDVANYVTASVSAGLSTWYATGSDMKGFAGQESIDIITGSMSLGDVFVVQTFSDGAEDISMDVTKIVSATLTGQLPDCGYRLSFSGTQETDDKTRFVKRFASRHSTNPLIRPTVLVGFDDSIRDNHGNFYFNSSGSLFINNFSRGVPSNIVSGTLLTQITGTNSLRLTLTTGSIASGTFYSKTVNASQHYVGQNAINGVYSASFAISQWDSGTILNEVLLAHSATFTETWGSLDGSIGYYTGTIVVYESDVQSPTDTLSNVIMTCSNIKSIFKQTEKVRFRVFAQNDRYKFKTSKLPLMSKSLLFDNMHYRVIDSNNNELLFDFDTEKNSTRLSTDSDGMYFDLYMSDLTPGSTYAFDILLNERGVTQVFKTVGGTFRIEQ